MPPLWPVKRLYSPRREVPIRRESVSTTCQVVPLVRLRRGGTHGMGFRRCERLGCPFDRNRHRPGFDHARRRLWQHSPLPCYRYAACNLAQAPSSHGRGNSKSAQSNAKSLSHQDLNGKLVVIEEDKMRIRGAQNRPALHSRSAEKSTPRLSGPIPARTAVMAKIVSAWKLVVIDEDKMRIRGA